MVQQIDALKRDHVGPWNVAEFRRSFRGLPQCILQRVDETGSPRIRGRVASNWRLIGDLAIPT
jgi:hypothetical protein